MESHLTGEMETPDIDRFYFSKHEFSSLSPPEMQIAGASLLKPNSTNESNCPGSRGPKGLNDSQCAQFISMDSAATMRESVNLSESDKEDSLTDLCVEKSIILETELSGSSTSASNSVNDSQQQTNEAFYIALKARTDSIERQTNLNHGIRRFNLNPKKGLKYLQERGIIMHVPSDPKGSAARVAHFLRTTRGLNKEQIGQILGDDEAESVKILEEYVNLFVFDEHGPTIYGVEMGLRTMLAHFKPPGESQKIDRILDFFSKKFVVDNCMNSTGSEQLQEFSAETTLVIAYLVIMLNVDLHNPNNSRRMTKKQFLDRCRGLDQGKDLPLDQISALYDRIHSNEIRHIVDRDDLSGNLYTNPDKCGWLLKKGTGRFSRWKRRWFLLSENTLYYFKHSEDVEPLGWIPLENVEILSGPMNLSSGRSLSALDLKEAFLVPLPSKNGGFKRKTATISKMPVQSQTSQPQTTLLTQLLPTMHPQKINSQGPLNWPYKRLFTWLHRGSSGSKECFSSESELSVKSHDERYQMRQNSVFFEYPKRGTRSAFSFDICTLDPNRKGVKSVKMSKKGSIVLGNHEQIKLRAESRQEAESWIRVLNQKNILTGKMESMKRKVVEPKQVDTLASM